MSAGGTELLLRHGGYRAVVTEVGGGLRSVTHEGRALIREYPADAVRFRYSGALLAPWPNRIADGRYTFDDETLELPLTEHERRTALHGLVCWDRFALDRVDEATVVARLDLVPRDGYPFPLRLEATYALGDDGLRTTVRARNTGDRPAPWGTAAHPYLRAGDGHVDDWVLEVPATRVLEVDPERLLPRPAAKGGPVTVPVAEGPLDPTTATRIGAAEVDHTYAGLVPDADGLVRLRLHDPATGDGVALTWDPDPLPWLQLHTADLPGHPLHRTGLAAEPMTCPPDAFGSGVDLVVLQPGASHEVSWTLGAA